MNAQVEFIGSDEVDLVVDGVDETNDDSQQVLIFVNEWLTTISDAVIGLFLFQILEITSISKLGRIQLTVDIDYLRWVHVPFFNFCCHQWIMSIN